MLRGVACLCMLWMLSSFTIVEGKAAGLSPRTLVMRGGSTDPLPAKKKKKRKKTDEEKVMEEKEVIREAMREKDSAAALGDAIRYVV